MRYRMNNFVFITSKYSICNITIMENTLVVNIIIVCHSSKNIL